MASVKIVGLPDCIKVPKYQEVITPVTVEYSISTAELKTLAGSCSPKARISVGVGGPSKPQLVKAGIADISPGSGKKTVFVTWKPPTSWMQGVHEVTFIASLITSHETVIGGNKYCDETAVTRSTYTTKVAYGVDSCEGRPSPGPGPSPGPKPNRKYRIISKEFQEGISIDFRGSDTYYVNGRWWTSVFFNITIDPYLNPTLRKFITKQPVPVGDPCTSRRYKSLPVIAPRITLAFGSSRYTISPVEIRCGRTKRVTMTLPRLAGKFTIRDGPPRVTFCNTGVHTVDFYIRAKPPAGDGSYKVGTLKLEIYEEQSPTSCTKDDFIGGMINAAKKHEGFITMVDPYSPKLDVLDTVRKVIPDATRATLTIWGSKKDKIQIKGPYDTQPPALSPEQIVDNWRNGQEWERQRCEKDGKWYWVIYPATLDLEVPGPFPSPIELIVNKTAVNVGEPVTFTVRGNGVVNVSYHVEKDGEWVVPSNKVNGTTFELKFSEPGSYKVVASGYDANWRYIGIDSIVITVVGGASACSIDEFINGMVNNFRNSEKLVGWADSKSPKIDVLDTVRKVIPSAIKAILTIYGSKKDQIQIEGPFDSQPPARSEDEIVDGWKNGFEIERQKCSKDGKWYLVTYPAKLDLEVSPAPTEEPYGDVVSVKVNDVHVYENDSITIRDAENVKLQIEVKNIGKAHGYITVVVYDNNNEVLKQRVWVPSGSKMTITRTIRLDPNVSEHAIVVKALH